MVVAYYYGHVLRLSMVERLVSPLVCGWKELVARLRVPTSCTLSGKEVWAKLVAVARE